MILDQDQRDYLMKRVGEVVGGKRKKTNALRREHRPEPLWLLYRKGEAELKPVEEIQKTINDTLQEAYGYEPSLALGNFLQRTVAAEPEIDIEAVIQENKSYNIMLDTKTKAVKDRIMLDPSLTVDQAQLLIQSLDWL